MKVLAIETATPASSIALGDGGELVAMSVNVDARGHVGFLVPAIDFCFEQAGWKPADLDGVAVDIGPGPYTGLRAGIAAAQGIAAAVGVPVVTASSLTVLALRAATGRRRIWPIVDVRRDLKKEPWPQSCWIMNSRTKKPAVGNASSNVNA